MKPILIILFLSLNLFSLDINEAIQRALTNNPNLKEKAILTQVSQESTNLAYSGFKPNLDLSYGYSEFSNANFVGADSSSFADATISYNLFNGFLDLFNLKASEENEKVSRFIYQAAKADLTLQVNSAYINYQRSNKQIKVAQDTITLLEQQLHDAKNFFDQGLFAKNDYLQVDVELSSAKQALLAANKNVKVSFYRLKNLLGSELSKEETLEELSKDVQVIHPQTLKEKMLFNRSELKLLNAQKNSLEYQHKASASSYYPKMDIQAKYQVAGVDPIPNGGATFQIHDQTTTTLNLSWNLYKGGADEANRASLLYQERASYERLNALHLELEFQLEEAIEEYELSKNQIRVATKALEQAEENFRITKNQYDENIANTSLMLDAQRFLAQTQVNYYTAYFALYDAMGTLERVVEEKLF